MYVESRIADNLDMKNSNFIPAKAHRFLSTRCHVENYWQITEEQPFSKRLGWGVGIVISVSDSDGTWPERCDFYYFT